MYSFPLFILDSGDPDEFREISNLANKSTSQLWGATTNPTLIAKSASWRIAGKKVTQQEAFALQKQIVLEIVNIVPGQVSAEVYADENTSADEMIGQGREIANWHERIVVKLPTTLEGFKARSELRKNKIAVNNTLVFSTEQIFAICLHEQIMQDAYGPIKNLWPPFISPFVGRLDDIGQNGIQLVEQGMKMKKKFSISLWMLEASVRHISHLLLGSANMTELITAPANVYREWFSLSEKEKKAIDATAYAKILSPLPNWRPSNELLAIKTEQTFFEAIENKKLNISHPLTSKGITRFTQDWKTILSQ